MTPRARTTMVVGVAAVVVVAGLAVAGWPWVMERYWAGRFADESLSVEDRQEAANKLAETGSPLLATVAVDAHVAWGEYVRGKLAKDGLPMSKHEFPDRGHPELRVASAAMDAMKKWRHRGGAEWVDVLVTIVEEGTMSRRSSAVSFLEDLAKLAASRQGERLVRGCHSEDRWVRRACFGILVAACGQWVGSEGSREGVVTLEAFAARFGLQAEDVGCAIAAGFDATGERQGGEIWGRFLRAAEDPHYGDWPPPTRWGSFRRLWPHSVLHNLPLVGHGQRG